MSQAITPEQRDAIYELVREELTGFEDLMRAVDRGDLETAYRLGRLHSDCLRLIMDGVGWGEHHGRRVSLSIPEEELQGILRRLRDRAANLYERERPEMEELQIWERTGLVRDTCDELLANMAKVELTADGS
jgi:hypothetical protein